MRARVLFGGIVSAVALAVVPAASASHDIDCSREVAVVCTVLRLTCHPHYHPCG